MVKKNTKTRKNTKIQKKTVKDSKKRSNGGNGRAKRLIIGNWKMNPQSPLAAKEIFLGIRKTARGLARTKTVICPPFVYVSDLMKLTDGKQVAVGVQNISHEDAGAFTGEVSAPIAKNTGASYAIVGHSERRAMGETNELVNKKVLRALAAGLQVVLCVGEKQRDQAGDYLDFLKEELQKCLAGVERADLRKIIIAYEPVWAIGKSDADAMQPRDIHEMSIYIKKVLSDFFHMTAVANMPVLYGGSVTSRISEGIFRDGQIDGLLVGRASLDPKDFSEILKQAETI